MFSLKSFSSLLALATVALGHGSIQRVQVGDRSYPGSTYGSQANSPVRRLSNMGEPITDPNAASMICGVGASRAPISAAARPGARIQFFWRAEGSNGPWFHREGPMVTYITRCPGDCKDFTPTASTQWAKIGQQGQRNPATTGGWIQQDLLSGAPSVVTLPNNLSNGNYLVRHEIITLQRANVRGGAEYYPNCLQISVTGGSSGGFSASPSVRFPGAYRPTDPGILVDVYTPSSNRYVIPGGSLATLSTGGGNGGGNNNPAPPPPAPVSSASRAPASTSQSRAPASTQAPVNVGATPPPATPPVNAPTCRRKRSARERRALNKRLAMHKRRLPTSY